MIGRDIPQSQDAFMKDMAIDIMARTLWGEARGEGEGGMRAVACVIINRVKLAQQKGGYWWGTDIFSVCQKPYQFSCWNHSDPNRDKLLAVCTKNATFAAAKRIAQQAINGDINDITMGATHYHTRAIRPTWARGQTPCALIGDHVFYRIP